MYQKLSFIISGGFNPIRMSEENNHSPGDTINGITFPKEINFTLV